jgi:hypothetical protein
MSSVALETRGACPYAGGDAARGWIGWIGAVMNGWRTGRGLERPRGRPLVAGLLSPHVYRLYNMAGMMMSDRRKAGRETRRGDGAEDLEH